MRLTLIRLLAEFGAIIIDRAVSLKAVFATAQLSAASTCIEVGADLIT